MRSSDYHDYVIKNGKLIGDFEGMYNYSSEIPWHQDQTAYWITSTILLELVALYGPYANACEIGCGLGYFSNRLFEKLHIPITGYDISSVAIEKATKRYPKLFFKQMDITKDSKGYFDCIIVKEILWYVFPHLDTVIQNIGKMLSNNGTLVISQSFPPNSDYVGRRVISSPNHLRDIFASEFELQYFAIHATKESGFSTTVELVYRKGELAH